MPLTKGGPRLALRRDPHMRGAAQCAQGRQWGHVHLVGEQLQVCFKRPLGDRAWIML